MTGKTWLITGASSGFGLQLSTQLLMRGDRVAATVRKLGVLDELKAWHGDRLWVTTLDMTDTAAAIGRQVDAAFDAMGTIDAVVSNAGYVLLGTVEEADESQIRHQIDTNLIGSILFIRAALPHLRAQGRGQIIQMSSESGQMTFPALGLYQATKWGIEGFCDSLRQDLAQLGISVTLVEPGRAATSFDSNAVLAAQMLPDYQKTTVGNYRRLLAMGRFPSVGDPVRMIRAIIAVTDLPDPPERLVLGSDAYRNIHNALTARLYGIEMQRDTAGQTDQKQ